MVCETVSVPGAISGSGARAAAVARAGFDLGIGRVAVGLARAFRRGRDAGMGSALASPSSTAIGVLTFTPSVPAGTSSFDTLPSSTASTSMVALSVSISAMMSPGLMAWPSVIEPLGELALLHGRRERGHQDLGRHFLGLFS